ncbi:MAG TPA: hypothetical protein VJT74_04995 [Pyrinomonadaceae bacterium]|nr:hypothetical protein [Pyrinomonadaceae bacterium]
MAKAAIYDVISDGNTSLRIGGDIDADLNIQLSSNADVGVRSVLSFMLKAEDPNNLDFRLSIINGNNNTTEILRTTVSSNVWRVWQEVVDANVLTATGNKLRIKVLSGGGTLVISDIVLLYFTNA